jgi:hypothetical protein
MYKTFFLVGLLATSSVYAREVCDADIATYCLGVLQLGHSELDQCLINHYDDLSSGCRGTLPKDAKSRIQPPSKKPLSTQPPLRPGY